MPGLYDEEVSYEIPILQDVFGNTPLDICLDITEMSEGELKLFSPSSENDVNIGENLNTAMAELIFQNIKDYGIMHSSYCLNHAIISAIEYKL